MSGGPVAVHNYCFGAIRRHLPPRLKSKAAGRLPPDGFLNRSIRMPVYGVAIRQNAWLLVATEPLKLTLPLESKLPLAIGVQLLLGTAMLVDMRIWYELLAWPFDPVIERLVPLTMMLPTCGGVELATLSVPLLVNWLASQTRPAPGLAGWMTNVPL